MDLSKLTDQELHNRIGVVTGEEKEKTMDVIRHLEEADYRKLYLTKGYPSLFEYFVTEFKYSRGAAHRRIASMRVIKKIPEAREKLDQGSVNITTLTQLHVFIKNEEKTKSVSNDDKLELLTKIENKSEYECEREFVRISPQALVKEKAKPITESLDQYIFVGPKELKLKFDRIRNLTAHKNPNPTMGELLDMMADLVLKQIDPLAKGPVSNESETKGESKVRKSKVQCGASSGADVSSKRQLPHKIKREIWIRDHGQCQYLDKTTNKKCESQFALEIDHIHPFSLGGSNHESNLRLLCRNHNQWRTENL